MELVKRLGLPQGFGTRTSFWLFFWFWCVIFKVRIMKTTHFGTMLMVKDADSFVTPLPGRTFIDVLVEAVNQTKYSLDIIQDRLS